MTFVLLLVSRWKALPATELVLAIENYVIAIFVEYCRRLNVCYFDRDGRFGGLEP